MTVDFVSSLLYSEFFCACVGVIKYDNFLGNAGNREVKVEDREGEGQWETISSPVGETEEKGGEGESGETGERGEIGEGERGEGESGQIGERGEGEVGEDAGKEEWKRQRH